MKLLANENFPVRSFNIIKDAGYDAIHIGIQNPSINDEEVGRVYMIHRVFEGSCSRKIEKQ
ncbi:MAG: DUF5615 family PIN-like protein [Saprospiraceae bacterium]|nr:DUF5615 family PIN-like protein [Saprospiraceae bacterium]